MRSIPRMFNIGPFVDSGTNFYSLKAIMFNIVDTFKIKYTEKACNNEP